MKKVLVFLVIIGGLAMLEPRSREKIFSFFPALSAATHQRSAERAVKLIALDVQQSAEETGVYPHPNAFAEWLERSDQKRNDPWGSLYYIELYPDSFVVGSPGPDSRTRSGDDVRLAKLRGPNAERLQPGYSPPAPPPSGVKASAIRGAKKAATREKN